MKNRCNPKKQMIQKRTLFFLSLTVCLGLSLSLWASYQRVVQAATTPPSNADSVASNVVTSPRSGGWQDASPVGSNPDYKTNHWEFWDAVEYRYQYTYQKIIGYDLLGNPIWSSNRIKKMPVGGGRATCGPALKICYSNAGQPPMPLALANDERLVKSPHITNWWWGNLMQSNLFWPSSPSRGGSGQTWPPSSPSPIDNTSPIDNKIQNEASIKAQKPFLVLGHDPSSPAVNPSGSNSGYHNREMEIELWVPEPNQTPQQLTLKPIELCASPGDRNTNTGGAYVKVWLKNPNNSSSTQTRNIFGANDCSVSSKTISLPVKIKSKLQRNEVKELYNTSLNRIERYYRYQLIAEIAGIGPKHPNSYYNQFRLEVTSPSGAYLTFAETPETDTKDENALGISSRSNTLSYLEDNRNLVTLWEIAFVVAPDAEEGCSAISKRSIGLYDHDFPSSARVWQRDKPPTVKIYKADREDYVENHRTASFTFKEKIVFNDVNKQSNEWDIKKGIEFKHDEVYKLHFYNFNSQSWIQIKVPFNQINSLEKCVFKPLFKVNYSDLSAGGRFGTGQQTDSCASDEDRDVLSNADPAKTYGHISNKRGSSTQYAAYINDQVLNFYSKYPYPADRPPPNPAYQLTPDNQKVSWGGYFKGVRCLHNYWRGTKDLKATTGSTTLSMTDLSRANNQVAYHKPAGGTLTLTNSTPPTDHLKATLYVDGDLIIADNITNNKKDVQNFKELGYINLIVKGDIYIEPDVATIDAVLVAYPDRQKNNNKYVFTGGRIWTCHVASLKQLPKADKAEEHNKECRKNKLTINGALIAQRIYLGRAYNDSAARLTDYGVVEEINLMPEYFVTTPNLPTFNDWIYNVDSVVILPPNF